MGANSRLGRDQPRTDIDREIDSERKLSEMRELCAIFVSVNRNVNFCVSSFLFPEYYYDKVNNDLSSRRVERL